MLYVALGRNVGSEPMSEPTWRQFIVGVSNTIQYCEDLELPDTKALGTSNYAGMSEETCVLVWFDKVSTLSEQCLIALERIAVEYGQEAIAWTVADTKFIETKEVN